MLQWNFYNVVLKIKVEENKSDNYIKLGVQLIILYYKMKKFSFLGSIVQKSRVIVEVAVNRIKCG